MYSIYRLLGVITTLNKNILFSFFPPDSLSEDGARGWPGARMNVSSSRYGGGKQM
jgi:hypothetical protein